MEGPLSFEEVGRKEKDSDERSPAEPVPSRRDGDQIGAYVSRSGLYRRALPGTRLSSAVHARPVRGLSPLHSESLLCLTPRPSWFASSLPPEEGRPQIILLDK